MLFLMFVDWRVCTSANPAASVNPASSLNTVSAVSFDGQKMNGFIQN
jgi:hypothetical protein